MLVGENLLSEDIGSAACRGLCYYLYLKRYGVHNDPAEQPPNRLMTLWECMQLLDLDVRTAPKNIGVLLRSLRTTLAKAQDKINDIRSVTSYADSVGCLDSIECRQLYRSTLDLLRVSATLYIQVALELDAPENIELIRTLPQRFPERPGLSGQWLAGFSGVPFIHIDGKLYKDPRKQKLYKEALSLEATLLKAMHDFYDSQTQTPRATRGGTRCPTFPTSHQPQASIRWDLDSTFQVSEHRELQRIQDDLQMVKSLQEALANEVEKSRDPLDQTESNMGNSRNQCRQVNMELIASARERSRSWTLEAGAVGAVCGAVAGLLAGPAGAVVGLAAGGALGGATGQALKTRQRQQLTELEERLQRPSLEAVDVNGGEPLASARSSEQTASVRPPTRTRTRVYQYGGSAAPISFYLPAKKV
eukprot:Protomagalhaensia_sp_Gyna_25__824@NODE_139_length_4936_cov_50_921789_g109_i0_p3_GENE_NODE_139_length_4936_cov_50_921789_g109_i0NODE_139_length_4936_cov_50_921789_g109_i0_p3_ORF_typecomplete_len418_score66_95DUF1269/PF06897_12/8_4e06DUF3482/PF11981_8/8_7e06Sporozoite_P67/PF05642_11/0_0015DUF456/PF04306_13/0_0029TraT/PF05818_12/0_0048DUF3040/PF11239_8/0_16DUF3040/PF11239_8/1_3e02Glyzipper_Omp/PF13488_6/0_011Prominin/PF05478_11/0_74Prominin/PF05478_11/0_94DUF4126/PF13548_6/0_1WEMBL/PF05701_11/3_4e0